MAVYDLEEQEQLDELKSWWKQYGRLVALVASAALLTAAGIMGWTAYRDRQALDAGELYSQLQAAVGAQQPKKVQDIAGALLDKYPRTSYAAFAALAAAKAAAESGELAAAKARLQWVADNGRDDEIREIARLRVAAILLEEKQYDAALKLLETRHGEAMSVLYADLRGDVLVAQGRSGEARGAYQLALDKSDAKSPYRMLIQMKLDALGEAK